MTRTLRNCVALTAVLLTCTAAQGQFPHKFTNLKVRPKDISKRELQSTMRSFAFALGVRCENCHVEKKEPEKGFDFAADDKDTKEPRLPARHYSFCVRCSCAASFDEDVGLNCRT